MMEIYSVIPTPDTWAICVYCKQECHCDPYIARLNAPAINGRHGSVSYIIDTVREFLPKCSLTTVRSRFSADQLQIVRGEAKSASNCCKRTLWKKKRLHVSDLYDNNCQLF